MNKDKIYNSTPSSASKELAESNPPEKGIESSDPTGFAFRTVGGEKDPGRTTGLEGFAGIATCLDSRSFKEGGILFIASISDPKLLKRCGAACKWEVGAGCECDVLAIGARGMMVRDTEPLDSRVPLRGGGE